MISLNLASPERSAARAVPAGPSPEEIAADKRRRQTEAALLRLAGAVGEAVVNAEQLQALDAHLWLVEWHALNVAPGSPAVRWLKRVCNAFPAGVPSSVERALDMAADAAEKHQRSSGQKAEIRKRCVETAARSKKATADSLDRLAIEMSGPPPRFSGGGRAA